MTTTTDYTTVAEAEDAYVDAVRNLRVLPDRSAAGQFASGGYSEEWRRLLAIREAAAKCLTGDQLRAANERARWAC